MSLFYSIVHPAALMGNDGQTPDITQDEQLVSRTRRSYPTMFTFNSMEHGVEVDERSKKGIVVNN